jgi:hypothetical protein
MKRTSIVGALVVAGLALVPIGCGDGSSSTAAADRAAGAGRTDHVAHDAATPATTAPSRLDVVATEYEWHGLPDELPAGSYPVTFRDEGREAHEISIFRNRDRVPLDELLELGPVGIRDAVDMAGTLVAGAGSAAAEPMTITLTPGEYEVVCFLPAASDGKAHFHHGMHRTLTVTRRAS